MKKLHKVIFFAFLLMIPARICISQSVTSNTDTTQVNQQKSSDSQSAKQDQEQSQVRNEQQGSNTNGDQTVKQVKGARPDMSKARGARPPSIVRQSGSGIPKGIGRPGGAGKRGGR
jgi:hypothetical protein